MKFHSLPFYLLRSLRLLKSCFEGLHYRSIANIHKKAKLFPSCNVVNLRSPSSIKVGANTLVLGELLTFAHQGQIEVGESCFIGENSRIWSAASVTIGNRVLISHNVNIHDTDGHPVDAQLRHEHFNQISTVGHPIEQDCLPSSPVCIQDDVWIGFNCTILKGVTVGQGAIIGASSVVTKDVLANTIVAGNPACFIRKVIQNESR
jgi:acetyltransferase-like isoleucine patch superfamily enzyme